MARYPISIPRSTYRGHDPAKLRKAAAFDRLAHLLERHINAEMEKCTDNVRVFSYGLLAIDLGLQEPDVENVLYGVDCGGNGITVSRR